MTDPIRVNSAQPIRPANDQPAGTQRTGQSGDSSFAETLAKAQGLRFSNHAQKRMEVRNINLGDDGIARLANAVEKAEKRGGRESLVLVDNLAFLVNVRERLVVTALDDVSRGEGVFTQIDSVVFADSSDKVNGGSNEEKSS